MRIAYNALKHLFVSSGLMQHTRDAAAFDRVMKRIESGDIVLVVKGDELDRLRADNKHLKNLNQAALYWLLGIEESIASNDHGRLLGYFDDGEMERLAAFIEVMRDEDGV